MTSLSNTHADGPFPSFLWDALFLGNDVRRTASRDVDRIMQELGEADLVGGSGVDVRIEVAPEEIESLLLPLALATQNLASAKQQRVLVGVTGGAGTGKTILSVLLCRVLHVLSGQEIAVSLGMDAYHFPNAFLDTQVAIEQGKEVPLRQMKGRPPSYDVQALVADLRCLRLSEADEIRLPVYDRGRHDPVPGSLCVRPHHRIIVVEGLHLLRPEPAWQEARACLDFCMLLELPLEACRRRLVTRKIAGGRPPSDVYAHFERVDRPTLEELQDPALRAQADLVIQLEEAEEKWTEPRTRLRGCERRENAVESVELRATRHGAVQLLAVGLNPALQKTLVFDRWVRGQVNRARKILWSVGGKGQQCARAASHLIPRMVTLAQFLGGENGERLGRMIERAGVNQITVAAAGETRCCITVIDTAAGEATELVEPSAPIPPGEVEQLLSRILQTLARGEISGLALCGTCPPGVDEEFYATLARAKGKAFLLLDSYREIAPTLATGHVDILKINAHELRSLAGKSRSGDRPATQEPVESIPEMALDVFAAHQLRWLAVTAGPNTAWLFERPCVVSAPCQPCTWRFYEFRLPAVQGVVNPIGAGDTAGAIFLAQLSAGAPAHAAFACGLAAGSASCRQLSGADFTMDDLHEILKSIRVSRITRWWTNGEGADETHLAKDG
jgi:fructose-1-phosphate kinase PfkB-like protein/pantothenate kinase